MEYLPPNETSFLQPIDQGIINSSAFWYAGFIKEVDIPEEFHDNISHNFSEDELLIDELCHRYPQLPEISFQGFLTADFNIICKEEISDDAIISYIIN